MALGGGAELLEVITKKPDGHAAWGSLGALFGLACCPHYCAELQRLGAAAAVAHAVRGEGNSDWWFTREPCGLLLRLSQSAAAAREHARLEALLSDQAVEVFLFSLLLHGEQEERIRRVAYPGIMVFVEARATGSELDFGLRTRVAEAARRLAAEDADRAAAVRDAADAAAAADFAGASAAAVSNSHPDSGSSSAELLPDPDSGFERELNGPRPVVAALLQRLLLQIAAMPLTHPTVAGLGLQVVHSLESRHSGSP